MNADHEFPTSILGQPQRAASTLGYRLAVVSGPAPAPRGRPEQVVFALARRHRMIWPCPIPLSPGFIA
jgi:hypothetical protein